MTRDLRKYSQQTSIRLIIGGIVILFLVGDGLILLLYGKDAALMGVMCLGIGLLPLILIGSVFWVMDFIVKRINEGE